MTFLLFDSRKFLDLFESMTSSAHSLWSVSLQSTWVTSTSSYVGTVLSKSINSSKEQSPDLSNNLLSSLSLLESSVLILKSTFGKSQFWKHFSRLSHLLISICIATNLMLLEYWSLQQFLLLVCSHQFELPNNLLNSLSLSESSVLVLKLTFGKLQFWKQFLRLFHLLISMCFLTNLMLLKYWSLQQFLVLICFHQFENKLYKYYYIVLITPASWE